MNLHTTWSVRQCFERADALATRLDGFHLTEGDLKQLIDDQRELIVHLSHNLKAGHATPPTPADGTPRKPMRPVTYGQPQPQPPSHVAPGHASTRPDGLLDARQAQAITGFSQAGFYMARQDGLIPKPHTFEGRSALWRPEQLEGIRKCRQGERINVELTG